MSTIKRVTKRALPSFSPVFVLATARLILAAGAAIALVLYGPSQDLGAFGCGSGDSSAHSWAWTLVRAT